VQLGNTHVFDYYREALRRIADEGLGTFLKRVGTPYVTRARDHFAPDATTYTQRALAWAGQRRADRAGH